MDIFFFASISYRVEGLALRMETYT
jgi:hypothetical protein